MNKSLMNMRFCVFLFENDDEQLCGLNYEIKKHITVITTADRNKN